jgi:hypothetical protein
VTGRRRRPEVRHLARRVRSGDVHDAQPVREPRDGDLGRADGLDRLVTAGELGLRRTVHTVNLKARERHRVLLVGDVHQPQERRRPRLQLGDVLVGHEQDPPALQGERHRQRGVRGRDERRTPVQAGDVARLGHVLDVEDDEAAVPVAHVEAVALTDRVVTAVQPALPRRRLPAGRPLPRHPPPPDFLGPRGIGQVEDHDDVALVAPHLRRDVGVAAVEREAVHAEPAASPEGDLARASGRRDVVNAKPAGAGAGLSAVPLAVHEHQAVDRAHLVRVRPRRHLQRGQLTRRRGIADVDQRRAVGRLHVGDARNPAVDHHLTAAGAVEPRDLSYALRARAVAAAHGSSDLEALRGPVS